MSMSSFFWDIDRYWGIKLKIVQKCWRDRFGGLWALEWAWQNKLALRLCL